MTHYIHDEKNNRIEGLSKEEIYALLAAAIQQGQLPSVDADTAFVTMFKSIVDGQTYKMGFCTQAQYNAMEAGGTLEANALYIITDDTSYDDIITYIDTEIENVKNAKQDAFQIVGIENNEITINKTGLYCITVKAVANQNHIVILCRIKNLNEHYRFKNDVVDILFNTIDATTYKFTLANATAYEFIDCETIFTDN